MAGKMRKIATEEAWSIPEVAAALGEVARGPTSSLDKLLVAAIYDAKADTSGYGTMNFLDGLLDVESRRLREMDEFGVDMHLLSLTAPGVQMFDADTATELAALANDRMADICKLKLNGFILNSHTHGEYLDDPKFWPVLEAAEALDACIYIHPRAASDGLKGPLQDYGMDSAMWGYGVEVGTHAVRMMAAGVFDRFPKLKIYVGHMGEAIPFWIWRITFMNTRAQAVGRAPKTQLTMEEYFRRNFVFTTSGVEDPLALDYSIKRMGIDNVLWAIDYPYQPMKPAVDFLDGAPLSAAELHKLYHENAERIFHIAPA
jgi:5-carboxyvanillate decarboxylase